MNFEPEKKAKVGYIKVLEENNMSFFDKLKFLYKYYFNVIVIKMAGSNEIYELPIYKNYKIKKNLNKIFKLLKAKLDENEINSIVLSDDIKEVIKNKKSLEEVKLNQNIITGKFLMKNISLKIIEKILEIKNEKIDMAKIYVLVENYSKENLDILYDLAAKVRNINIITSNIKNFRKFENRIFENMGIAISVANNKKKSLRRAEIILNFDFENETLKKYNINRNSIIINYKNFNINLETSFSGVIINNIEVSYINVLEYFEEQDLFKRFNLIELYESLIFYKYYDTIVRQNEKNRLVIKNLIGNRGIIDNSEILKLNTNQ